MTRLLTTVRSAALGMMLAATVLALAACAGQSSLTNAPGTAAADYSTAIVGMR